MGVIEELGAAARDVAARIGPSVVGIRGRRGRGSGVVIDEGRVATNAHNVTAEEVTVTFSDGREAQGRTLGFDLDGDLCVLEVETAGAPVIDWPDGEGPQMGEPVFALANPGGRGLRVSLGIVSAAEQAFRGPRGRRISHAVEHTAPLPRGSSGGPVVDGRGRVVAINTHRLGDGVYLALPVDAGLRGRLTALARGESPTRRLLGVGLAPPGAAQAMRRAVGLPEREGLLVRALEDGGLAERAGLRVGDLIVGAGGQPVTTTDDLHGALDAAEGSLALAVVRGVDELEFTVELG